MYIQDEDVAVLDVRSRWVHRDSRQAASEPRQYWGERRVKVKYYGEKIVLMGNA
jgi:hypothetical protein